MSTDPDRRCPLRKLRRSFWTIGALLLAVNSVLLAVALSHRSQLTPRQAAAIVGHIKERVTALDLTDDERIWDKPDWLTDYKEALEVARQTKRPIFLYAMFGKLD